MVADTGGHWTKGFATIVPIGFDDPDRDFFPHLHNEPSQPNDFFRGQRQFGGWFGTDDAVGMEPRVMDTHIDQPVQPLLAD